mgnify:CR=1 FL=1
MEPIAGTAATYVTSTRPPDLAARLLPSWVFYAKLLRAVFHYSAVARRHQYDAAAWHASSLAGLARTTPDTLDEIIQKISKFEALLSHYYFYLLVVILLAGGLLPAAWPGPSLRRCWAVTIAAPATFRLGLIASL